MDVPRHREIDDLVLVVPFNGDATIQLAFPIFGVFIVFFNGLIEMVSILFANVFYAKVVDD